MRGFLEAVIKISCTVSDDGRFIDGSYPESGDSESDVASLASRVEGVQRHLRGWLADGLRGDSADSLARLRQAPTKVQIHTGAISVGDTKTPSHLLEVFRGRSHALVLLAADESVRIGLDVRVHLVIQCLRHCRVSRSRRGVRAVLTPKFRVGDRECMIGSNSDRTFLMSVRSSSARFSSALRNLRAAVESITFSADARFSF